MSYMQFITARSRIYMDEPNAEDVVRGIQAAVEQLPDHWEVRESDFDQNNGHVDISIQAQGESRGLPGSTIGDAMEAINETCGQSGGAIIYESDFGVDGFELYGAAEAKDVELSETADFDWCFEDPMKLHVTMSAARWRSVLENDEEALFDLIESADVDLLSEKIIPRFFERVEDKSDEIAFQFMDVDPYAPDGSYGDEELVTALYELDGFELSGEAFELMLEGFDEDIDNLESLNAQVLLKLDNANHSEGLFTNTVADIDHMALLEFTSADNAISSIKVQVIEGIGLEG